MYVDPNGNAWWHWLIGASVIVACAALTVVTAGGFAAAGTAIASVFTATMAPTAASAVFAGAFVGASTFAVGGALLSGLSGENGWSWDNASQGFMWGSIAGALVGGAWGGTHYALQNAGKMAIKTNINNMLNNPLDDFVLNGAKPGAVSNYMSQMSVHGQFSSPIYARRIGKGVYEIVNGHHKVQALRQLGYSTVKFFLTI